MHHEKIQSSSKIRTKTNMAQYTLESLEYMCRPMEAAEPNYIYTLRPHDQWSNDRLAAKILLFKIIALNCMGMCRLKISGCLATLERIWCFRMFYLEIHWYQSVPATVHSPHGTSHVLCQHHLIDLRSVKIDWVHVGYVDLMLTTKWIYNTI